MALFEGTANNTIKYELDLGLDHIKRNQDANKYGRILSGQTDNVMRVMRFSQVLGNFYTRADSLARFYDISSDWRKVVPSTENETEINIYWNSLEMIGLCQFGRAYSCKERFSHVMTDRGICSAFNTVAPREILKESTFLQAFETIYDPAKNTVAFNSPGAGQQFKLSLLKDSIGSGGMSGAMASSNGMGSSEPTGTDFKDISKPFSNSSGDVERSVQFAFTDSEEPETYRAPLTDPSDRPSQEGEAQSSLKSSNIKSARASSPTNITKPTHTADLFSRTPPDRRNSF